MKNRMMTRLKTMLPLLIVGVLIDQLSKLWAVAYLMDGPRFSYFFDSVRILYATNHGAFLGFGSQLSPELRFWLLTAMVGAFLLGLFVYLLIGKDLDRLSLISLTLVFTGGGSNFIDRALNDGAVVDFLNVGIGTSIRTGIFNIADMYIMLGAGLMLIGPWVIELRAKRKQG